MSSVLEILRDVLDLLIFAIYSIGRAAILACVPAKYWSKKVEGQTILITGAASGFGLEASKRFGALGANIVLIDVNEAGLKTAVSSLKSKFPNQTFWSYVCDLSDRKAIKEMSKAIKKEVGRIDILWNNAGIVSGKPMLEIPDEMIEKTFAINSLAHFWMIREFLPDMLARDSGHLVYTASLAGLMCTAPALSDYGASKYANIGMFESLEFELRAVHKTTNIKQTVICPYFAQTGMFKGVCLKYDWLLPFMTTDYCVDRMIDGILTEQKMVILPFWAKIFVVLKHALPIRLGLKIAEFLGANDVMTTFVGKK